MRHSEITGADAVHQMAYWQSSDPGAVGPGKHWYDDSDADRVTLKVRNPADTDWVVVATSIGVLDILIGDGVNNLATGVKGARRFHEAGEIVYVELTAPYDATPSIVLDLWVDDYAAYPPTVGDTITASAKPTLVAERTYEDATLTGWSPDFLAGDHIFVNIDSVSSCKGFLLTIVYAKR